MVGQAAGHALNAHVAAAVRIENLPGDLRAGQPAAGRLPLKAGICRADLKLRVQREDQPRNQQQIGWIVIIEHKSLHRPRAYRPQGMFIIPVLCAGGKGKWIKTRISVCEMSSLPADSSNKSPSPGGRSRSLSTQADFLFYDSFLQGMIERFLSPSGRENAYAGILKPLP